MEPTFSDFEQASRLVGFLGGLAGIGTTVAAILWRIWRSGYLAGVKAEQARKMAQDLETIKQQWS